ncbi:MAG: hypothetical protein P1Q69_17825 [Candidatus Thorarchaeota archaeon]|nr:hypothetical protein [Candidatus Thorarchaeota archaeon]
MLIEKLEKILENDFDKWIESPDGTKILALKTRGNMSIFNKSSGEELVSIAGEYEACYWVGADRVVGHDYIITTIFDAATGEKIRHVEATY